MQNDPGGRPLLEMRLSEVKLFLYDTVGKQLEKDGYKFKKSNFSFKKKLGKDYIEIVFFFNNYAPLRFEIYFAVFVMNDVIQSIKARSPRQSTKENHTIFSMIFYLGDYVEETRASLNNNFRRYGGFHVTTAKDLFTAAEQIKILLEKDILPEVGQMLTMEGIAKFFRKRQIWWSISSLMLNNILAELISTKLAFPGDYEKTYTQIYEVMREKVGVSCSEEDLSVVEALDGHLRGDE